MSKYRCVNPFVHYPDGRETLYPGGMEVEHDDPVMESHRAHFEPVDPDEPARRPAVRVEEATAVPGEVRSVSTVKRAPAKGRKPAAAEAETNLEEGKG